MFYNISAQFSTDEVDCGIEIPNRKDTTDNNDATNDLPPNVSGKDEIHVLREASSILSQDPTKFEGKSDSEEALRAWALQHNITHVALKDLLLLIKIQYNDINLPSDPRTLLETPQNTGKLCLPIDGGKYWHNGVKDCLRKWFGNLSEDISISININIDFQLVFQFTKALSTNSGLFCVMCMSFPTYQHCPLEYSSERVNLQM